MHEHKFYRQTDIGVERTAYRNVSLATAGEHRDDTTSIRAARAVIAAHRAEGRVFGGRDESLLASALTRVNGIGNVGEATASLKADIAMQRMGRQRLEDIERGIPRSTFNPSHLVDSAGGVKGLEETRSRADTLALARGSFHDMSSEMQQSVYERITAARRAQLDQEGWDRTGGLSVRSEGRGLMAQAEQARGAGPVASKGPQPTGSEYEGMYAAVAARAVGAGR